MQPARLLNIYPVCFKLVKRDVLKTAALLDEYLKRSGFSKQEFIVLIRVNQSISDLVKRGFNLNGTLQFRIGSLNKQLRQWSFVCVVFRNTTV